MHERALSMENYGTSFKGKNLKEKEFCNPRFTTPQMSHLTAIVEID